VKPAGAEHPEGRLRLAEIFLEQQPGKARPEGKLADLPRRQKIVVVIEDGRLQQRIWSAHQSLWQRL
jgi:hypothetical protein